MNACQKCREQNKFCLKIQEVMPGVQSCANGGTPKNIGDKVVKCEYAQPCVAITEEECLEQGGRWCGPSSSTAHGVK